MSNYILPKKDDKGIGGAIVSSVGWVSLVAVNPLSSTPILLYRKVTDAYNLSTANYSTSMNSTVTPPAGWVHDLPDVFRDPWIFSFFRSKAMPPLSRQAVVPTRHLPTLTQSRFPFLALWTLFTADPLGSAPRADPRLRSRVLPRLSPDSRGSAKEFGVSLPSTVNEVNYFLIMDPDQWKVRT